MSVMFRSRTYQRNMRLARKAGCRNFCEVWHRRAGKDRNAAAFCLEEMLIRPGNYFHLYPALNQGRRDFWNNLIEERDDDGYKYTDTMVRIAFPPLLVQTYDNKEMIVQLKKRFGGGMYQIMGCEDMNAVARLRGPNPFGVIGSEYAHAPYMEKALDTLSPVFAQNGGWQVIVYTPHGNNHGKKLYDNALNNQFSAAFNPLGWHVEKLTIEDTRQDAEGEDGSPVVTMDYIEAEIKKGRRPEFIRQEYWCDFTGFEHATVYGDLVRAAQEDGRITEVGYTVNYPVGVCMDLGSGKSDAMAMWFYQCINNMVRFIDYVEGVQKDIAWAAAQMRQRPYQIGKISLPWDGSDACVYLTEVGFQNVSYLEHRNQSVQMGIDSARRQFPTFIFDRNKCARGIECLREYSRKYDEDRQVFEAPIHNQFSHGADALRTGVESGWEPLVFPGATYDNVRVYNEFEVRMPL